MARSLSEEKRNTIRGEWIQGIESGAIDRGEITKVGLARKHGISSPTIQRLLKDIPEATGKKGKLGVEVEKREVKDIREAMAKLGSSASFKVYEMREGNLNFIQRLSAKEADGFDNDWETYLKTNYGGGEFQVELLSADPNVILPTYTFKIAGKPKPVGGSDIGSDNSGGNIVAAIKSLSEETRARETAFRDEIKEERQASLGRESLLVNQLVELQRQASDSDKIRLEKTIEEMKAGKDGSAQIITTAISNLPLLLEKFMPKEDANIKLMTMMKDMEDRATQRAKEGRDMVMSVITTATTALTALAPMLGETIKKIMNPGTPPELIEIKHQFDVLKAKLEEGGTDPLREALEHSFTGVIANMMETMKASPPGTPGGAPIVGGGGLMGMLTEIAKSLPVIIGSISKAQGGSDIERKSRKALSGGNKKKIKKEVVDGEPVELEKMGKDNFQADFTSLVEAFAKLYKEGSTPEELIEVVMSELNTRADTYFEWHEPCRMLVENPEILLEAPDKNQITQFFNLLFPYDPDYRQEFFTLLVEKIKEYDETEGEK